MDPATVSLITGIASSGANVGGGILNYLSQRETNQMNRDLVAEQNRQNFLQWERENAYNNPVNVVQRLRAAGLNPALMYEGGAGQLQSAPSPEMQASRDIAPQMTGSGLLDPLTMAQIQNLNAHTDELKSEVGVNGAKVRNMNEDSNRLRAISVGLGLENGVKAATMMSEIASINATNANAEAEAKAKAKFVEDTAQTQYDMLIQSLDNLKNDGKIKEEQYNEAKDKARQAKAAASVAEYAEQFKGFEYWFEKALQAGKMLTDIIETIALLRKWGINVEMPK